MIERRDVIRCGAAYIEPHKGRVLHCERALACVHGVKSSWRDALKRGWESHLRPNGKGGAVRDHLCPHHARLGADVRWWALLDLAPLPAGAR